MDTANNRVVLFADILGFAALTEENPVDLRLLRFHSRPFSTSPDEFYELLSGPKNPLAEVFSRFHTSLEGAISLAQMRHPLTAITFSDSVFIATSHFFHAADIAVNLARSTLTSKVPVRMGIAHGSFAALRFRSDVSADGGNHASQFLGSAVVRSYQAEKCGIRGMRIFIHPSAEPLLVDRSHNPPSNPIGTTAVRPLPVSTGESANQCRVQYEVNYWDLAATKEAHAWRSLQDMWAAAPEPYKEHYQATAAAIDRMRTAQGESPLADLRRRTLPRAMSVKRRS